MNEWMMYFYGAISMFAHGALQQFAGDFGQTAFKISNFGNHFILPGTP